ncbi:ABC transporter permease [Microvirga roseola]|uniref:ABC transporter permease n=1 Tax=Microvirga roseola TaxID=2883126 RepID=UPI001E2DEB13|nr:ABC transporter permease [Microvirga roseola]
MNKLRPVTGRLLKSVAIIATIIILNFLLIRLAPGDPAAAMAGEAGAADEAFMAQLREQFGLDRPVYEQLAYYFADIVRFDLGYSYRQRESVLGLIMDRLPATLLLTISGFVVALGLGLLLGIASAMRVGRVTDRLISLFALLFYATPLFWVGLMAIMLFSVWLGWLPSFGMESVGAGYTGWARAADIAHHLILPAGTLGLFYVAVYTRLTRASMLEVKDMDFVRTARAKGLRRGLIVRRHILRNAMLPIITFAGIQAGQLVGGAVLTETVFAWPGIGRLAFDALLQRDYPVLLGVFLVTSIMVVVFNIVTDIAYRIADPRIEVAS